MSNINEFFKVALIKATEQLEADGHYDNSFALNLFAGPLITTIESQKEEIERLKALIPYMKYEFNFEEGDK